MRILLTGATGLIGNALGTELHHLGHDLLIVSRNRKQARSKCSFPCEIIEGDLGQGPITDLKSKPIDIVFNLAGQSIAEGRWTKEKKATLKASRVDVLKHLYSSLKTNLPAVIVSASAIGYYGNRGDELLTEQSQAGIGFLPELCLAWEAAALPFLNAGVRVVHPRIGIVLSRNGGALAELLPLVQFGLGGKLGNGQQWMSWIHLPDLVQSLIFAMEHNGLSGPFNAVSPRPIRNLEFIKTLAKLLNRPAFLPAPAFALRTLLGEKSQILTDSQKVIPSLLQELNFKYQVSQLEQALHLELLSVLK